MRKTILLITLLICVINANATNKQTFLYSTKGTDSLYLDVYRVDDSLEKPKGCVMFAFGGGFIGGQRNDPYYDSYFQFLNSLGYTAVSIDYRLGLKDIKKDTKPMDFIHQLELSVYMAVEDLFDATLFVLENAKEWNIDPAKIIVSGSSAGAITSLQAEYEICNASQRASVLPSGFNYQGVMSFAGAIISIGSQPQWKQIPCPLLLFHGDADTFVPFEKVGALSYYMYGSNFIVKQIKKLNASYYFYLAQNEDHMAMAGGAMNKHKEIQRFLEEYIQEEKRLQITEDHKDLSLPEKKNEYGLLDFISSLTPYANEP